jgi:glycosyltransferase involved in cell wall biosynthesis
MHIIITRSNPCDADPRVAKVGRVLKGFADVTVLAWDRTGELPKIEETDFGRVERCRVRSGYGSIAMLFKLVRFNLWLAHKLLFCRYDVVHACDLDTGFTATVVAAIRRKAVVYDMFDLFAEANAQGLPGPLVGVARALERWCVRRAKATIIVDDSRRKQIHDFQPQFLEVIYNAPEDVGSPSPSTDNAALEVFYTGVLAFNRGFAYFVPATATLESVALTIGGYGADEVEIKQLCDQYPNVQFIGKIPYSEVISRSQQSDVLFALYDPSVPNHTYSSPNKLFEAMMLGKPVIVSDGTGMSYIVQEVQNGLVVPYGDSEAWIEALRSLQDKARRIKMGNAGRLAYEEKYGWPVMAERLRQLYVSRVKVQ